MTRRVLFSAIAAAILTPAVIARWKRHQERRDFSEWLRELEPLRARHRDRMRAQGLDPDRMSEDEKMDYVVRVIHEYREEQRQK